MFNKLKCKQLVRRFSRKRDRDTCFLLLTKRILLLNPTAKSLQSCLTLCDPRDGSPPGSPVPGILQARTLEWVAISFSNAWKWKVKVKSLSRVWLLATPWTAAHQAPPPMGFSRQECWSGVPLPSPYLLIDLLLNNQMNFEQVWLKKNSLSFSILYVCWQGNKIYVYFQF